MKYRYKALKPGGEELIGEIEGVDEQECKAEIRKLGFYPIEIL